MRRQFKKGDEIECKQSCFRLDDGILFQEDKTYKIIGKEALFGTDYLNPYGDLYSYSLMGEFKSYNLYYNELCEFFYTQSETRKRKLLKISKNV